jgi:alpha-glucosidase (family GH31 glycosyl hydrolase)
MLTPNATARNLYLPKGTWLDFWTHAKHTGGQTITWTNPNQAQMPLFVREGAIVPMLLNDARTLCDANYVNDAQVKTMDGGLLVQIYPGGASDFTVFDGTRVHCQGDAASGTVTVSSTPRAMRLRILGSEPNEVRRDGAVVVRQAPPAPGPGAWQYDAGAGFIDVSFAHGGGTTTITY